MQHVSHASPRCSKVLAFLERRGEPAFRQKQVVEGIYKVKAHKWHAIYNLPQSVRWALKQEFGKYTSSIAPVEVKESKFANKVLFRCHSDNQKIEAVSLKFNTHRSLCISSQVGCAFACSFCATGAIGFNRQLTADELADQVIYFLGRGEEVDSVSFMGMGEPLGNPKLFDAIDILTDPSMLAMSRRRMNVSTIGVLPGIVKLTEKYPQVNLAFSLHSPFTEQRNKLVPLNRMYPFQEIFPVLDDRIKKTGRRIWVAYLLLKDVNDSKDHAEALAEIIRNRPVETKYLYHINLLPYNPTEQGASEGYKMSVQVELFRSILRANNISSSYRNAFGVDIDAACGQLYATYEAKNTIKNAAASGGTTNEATKGKKRGKGRAAVAAAPADAGANKSAAPEDAGANKSATMEDAGANKSAAMEDAGAIKSGATLERAMCSEVTAGAAPEDAAKKSAPKSAITSAAAA
eukprot:GEMP01054640.1.p1 GENE.GEMP01054640.1~~GEMP01054640.1.p1  ORF type:complete len:462 (+),score=95.63 GEMP01054640.1:10-1395(+)